MDESTFRKLELDVITKKVRRTDARDIIEYISKKDAASPITQEQWMSLLDLATSKTELAIWMIKEHLDLSQDAVAITACISDRNEEYLVYLEYMKEILEYILDNCPQGCKAQVIGTAFVLACKNNNLYLIKWLLEQGVDVNYRYENRTGPEAAQANMRSKNGIEDDTIINYLQNNIQKTGKFEDIYKYYPDKEYRMPEDPMKKVNGLLLDSALERANFLLEDTNPNLLSEKTSPKELHLFMEEYNWDDGLELPYFIMLHPNCQLATALMIFWLAEGGSMFEDNFADRHNVEWKYLLTTLHDRIVRGEYKVGEEHYQIPLNAVGKYKLKKKNVNEIFFADL